MTTLNLKTPGSVVNQRVRGMALLTHKNSNYKQKALQVTHCRKNPSSSVIASRAKQSSSIFATSYKFVVAKATDLIIWIASSHGSSQ